MPAPPPPSTKKREKPLIDEQVDKIVKQVEFYFSDANLPTDAFLMKKVRADPNGFVPIGVVCGFNRMKTLLKKHPPIETVAAILRQHSEALVVSEDGIRVQRATPLPDIDLEDVQARTVVAENFKTQPTASPFRVSSPPPATSPWFASGTRGCDPRGGDARPRGWT